MALNKGLVSLGIGMVLALLYRMSRTAQAAVTIQQQMISIIIYLKDVWVYRNGVWLVFSVPFPLTNTLDRIFPGETATIQVTQACTLTYGGTSYQLVAGQNTIIWR